MGTSTEQARQAVAATRGRVQATTDRLEARLRYDLDPRQRLRRDGPKLAAGLGVVVLVGAVYVIRSRRRHRAAVPSQVDWIGQMPKQWQERLQDLLAEAAAEGPLPREHRRVAKLGHRSLAESLALRAARMMAPVVVSAVAERIGRRQAGVTPSRAAKS